MFSVIKGKQFLYPALWDKPLSYTSNRIKTNPGHDWRQKITERNEILSFLGGANRNTSVMRFF